jgi:choline/glycine/proline betaine transport protein/glycine betaine transporter
MATVPINQQPSTKRAFAPLVFWVSASLTILFILWSALFPESMETVVNAIFTWTTEVWGWLYLLAAFLLVGGCIVLLVTKSGAMKLGHRVDRPEFSSVSWFAMLSGSAIAAGIVFWRPAEPAYHYMSRPPYMFLLLWVLFGTCKGLAAYRAANPEDV